ncbi:hypothetical protein GGF37_004375, partial [Kickxella alabastrina]
ESDDPEDAADLTNIGLFKTTNMTPFVRNVYVILDNQISLERFLDKYMDLFNFDIYDWSSACYIGMVINELAEKTNELVMDEPHSGLTSEFSSFADRLMANMPNVANL